MPKSAKSAAPQLVPDEVTIPDKIYFRIGEVSRLCRLSSSVLRYWETEFPRLRPSKGSTGQRMYRKPDVEYVLRIKKLLYDEGFTLAGARQRLLMEAGKKQPAEPGAPAKNGGALQQVRQGLKEILRLLSEKR